MAPRLKHSLIRLQKADQSPRTLIRINLTSLSLPYTSSRPLKFLKWSSLWLMGMIFCPARRNSVLVIPIKTRWELHHRIKVGCSTKWVSATSNRVLQGMRTLLIKITFIETAKLLLSKQETLRRAGLASQSSRRRRGQNSSNGLLKPRKVSVML